jgi:hypothetical protein
VNDVFEGRLIDAQNAGRGWRIGGQVIGTAGQLLSLYNMMNSLPGAAASTGDGMAGYADALATERAAGGIPASMTDAEIGAMFNAPSSAGAWAPAAGAGYSGQGPLTSLTNHAPVFDNWLYMNSPMQFNMKG